MQKRVSLARSIIATPELIFFDEPTTGLDPITADAINDLILEQVKDIGAAAVTITHEGHELSTDAGDRDCFWTFRSDSCAWLYASLRLRRASFGLVVETDAPKGRTMRMGTR